MEKNPLKYQIAANRERFETGSYFVFPSMVTHAQGTTRINEYIYEGEAFNIEEEFKTSQTSLLQAAIAAVELCPTKDDIIKLLKDAIQGL